MPPNTPIKNSDDNDIKDDELIWRRVGINYCEKDDNGIWHLKSSGLLKGPELSVDRACLTTVEKCLQDYSDYFIAQLEAHQIRSAGCIIKEDPLPDNPAHALVLNPKSTSSKLTTSQARQLKKLAKIVVPD